MGPTKNLRGQRFGRLTVLDEAPRKSEKGFWEWHCRCDCGNDKWVRAGNLNCGATRSCGCLHKEVVQKQCVNPRHDLRGQRFGRLVVLDEDPEKDKWENTFWWCLCDCGTRKLIRAAYLKNGTVKSCGCLRAETSRENAARRKAAPKKKSDKPKPPRKPHGPYGPRKPPKDLAGQRFGMLTVTDEPPEYRRSPVTGRGKWYYLCRCDCGRTKWCYGYDMTHGWIKSCDAHGYRKNGLPPEEKPDTGEIK